MPGQVEMLKNSLRMNTISSTLSRQTANQDFSSKLRQGASHSANFAAHVFDNVAPALPGGAVVSAALNDAASSLSSQPASDPAYGTLNTGLPPGIGSGNVATSMASLQQNMMSQNLYMIGLQRKFQQMSEEYMAVSNILKIKHEAGKNSISNMR